MMSNGHSWRRPKSFLLVCILLGALEANNAQQTSGEKLVKADDPSQITDAVMITSITVAGKSVDCGLFVKPPLVVQPVAPFQAGSDWLQQMAISLFNRTNKKIVFGAVTLMFLDTGDCRTLPCVAYGIRLGQVPIADAYSARTGQLRPDHSASPRLNWEPNQAMVVHVADYMMQIEKILSKHMPVTAVTKVAVHISPFFFDDGMRWNLGFYSVPDPEHHGKFIDLPNNYFPGQRERNWPPGYDR